jgi:hypothetical protein
MDTVSGYEIPAAPQHKWVKHTVEPIAIVQLEDDGTDQSGPEYFTDPGRPVETLMGCSVCGSLLTLEALSTECSGEDTPPMVVDVRSEPVPWGATTAQGAEKEGWRDVERDDPDDYRPWD